MALTHKAKWNPLCKPINPWKLQIQTFSSHLSGLIYKLCFFPPMISKHAHISLVNLFVMMMMVGILFSGCSKVHWTLKIETSLQIRKGSCSHFSSFWNEWSFSILSLKCEKLTIKIEHFYWRDFFAHILRFVPSYVHYLYFHFGSRSMTKEKLMLILGRDKQILPQEEWFVVYNFRIVTLLLLCGFCWVLLRCCWRGTRRHEFEIQVCTYTYLLLP